VPSSTTCFYEKGAQYGISGNVVPSNKNLEEVLQPFKHHKPPDL
jgi:hypothetical protein